MSEPITDVDAWLKTNGIKRKWADVVAGQIKKEYPYLAKAMKNQRSNRGDLDLILLVHHVLQGRFPLKSADKRPATSSV